MERKERTPRVISDTTLDRYLSAILSLKGELPLVRAVDVANRLGYSKACVSMAVKQMTREDLVRLERHSALALTAEGERRARDHRDRFCFFQSLLIQSGVGDDDAALEASALTRALSSRSCAALRDYLSARGIPAAEGGE